jgi:hypothetical protein
MLNLPLARIREGHSKWILRFQFEFMCRSRVGVGSSTAGRSFNEHNAFESTLFPVYFVKCKLEMVWSMKV